MHARRRYKNLYFVHNKFNISPNNQADAKKIFYLFTLIAKNTCIYLVNFKENVTINSVQS
jgi:hypothetical protein